MYVYSVVLARRFLSSESFVNILDKGLKAAFALAMSVVIGRYLGAKELGLFSLLTTATYIISAFCQGGTDITLSQRLGEDPGEVKTIIFTLIVRVVLFIPISMALFLAGDLSSIFKTDLSRDLLIIITLSFFALSSVFACYEPVLIVTRKTKILFLFTATVGVIFFIIKLVVLFESGKVIYKFILDAVELFVGVSLFFVAGVVRIDNLKEGLNFKLEDLKRFVVISFPYWLNAIFLILYSRADQIFLAMSLDALSVGYYASVIQIANISLLPIAAAIGTTLPSIIDLKLNNPDELRKYLRKLIGKLVMLSALWTLVLVLCSQKLLSWVYGSEFEKLYPLVPVYSLVVFVSTLGMIFGNWAIACKYNWFPIFRSVLGLIAVSISGYLLIPLFGLLGAILSALIAGVVANVLPYLCIEEFRDDFLGVHEKRN